MVLRSAGGLTVTGSRAIEMVPVRAANRPTKAILRVPLDTEVLDWTTVEEFRRTRQEWLQLVRWDSHLSSSTQILIAEIGGMMRPDKDGSWPSQDFLAASLGIAGRTVGRLADQAFERGWLVAQRGIEINGRRDGFGKSYEYVMAASQTTLQQVLEDRDLRIREFKETRRVTPFRTKLADMMKGAITAKNGGTYQPELADQNGQNCPIISAKNGRLTYSENLTTEPDHGTSEERGLSEKTVRDESFCVPSVTISELHGLLGEGDEAVGARRAARLSKGRLAYLAEQIELEGIVGAAPDIQSAIRLAITLEKKTKTEVSP